MAAKKKTVCDPDAMLDQFADKQGKKKGKKSAPEIREVDEVVAKLADEFLDAMDAEDTALSIQADRKASIVPWAERNRRKLSVSGPDVVTTVTFKTASGRSVAYAQDPYFCKIPYENGETIRAIADVYEDIEYDEYFRVQRNLSLKKDLDQDTRVKVIKRLMEAFGDEFGEYFDIDRFITADKSLATGRVKDSKVDKFVEDLQSRGLLKPYSAELKRG